jgi:3-oxoacyl-[acyl-carrier-protein] synthase III
VREELVTYRRVIAQEEEVARGIGAGRRGVAFFCFVFCEGAGAFVISGSKWKESN